MGSETHASPIEAHGTLHADSNTGDPAIHGDNSSDGVGVEGSSDSGLGVIGRSDSGLGVIGSSDSGPGVGGSSNSGPGVIALSDTNVAVLGRSDTNIGVGGLGGSIGVRGLSVVGAGVEGSSDSGSGTGVLARNTGNGLALDVHGPARFSTAGAGTIPANQNSVAVNDPAVTANSHITMTLTGNPGSVPSGLAAVVVWIERQPGTGFVARLSSMVTKATPFTYLIVEPG